MRIVNLFKSNLLIILIFLPRLANLLNNSKACRAVANANANNPLPIIIPCHRVIRSSGELGGYRGGFQSKRYLLNLENKKANF